MGEISEMMLDGTLCQLCGTFIDDKPPGHPVTCGACRHEDRIAHSLAHPSEKVKCHTCGKKVKAAGLADHVRDVHGYKSPEEGNLNER